MDRSYLSNRHGSDLEALQRLCRGQKTIICGLLDTVCLESLHPFGDIARKRKCLFQSGLFLPNNLFKSILSCQVPEVVQPSFGITNYRCSEIFRQSVFVDKKTRNQSTRLYPLEPIFTWLHDDQSHRRLDRRDNSHDLIKLDSIRN